MWGASSVYLAITLLSFTVVAHPHNKPMQQPMAVPTDRLYDTPPLPSPASPAAFVPLISASPEATYHDEPVPPPEGMELFELAVSGPVGERVNLAFFADGYTLTERDKFVEDARKLTDDIVRTGPMVHVADLVNVFGVFVPSEKSGLGQDKPLVGSPFGLFRSGSELRGVYVAFQDTARAACKYWNEAEKGGCDQAILLGNDGLYGGLGGEFTVITASPLNGPLVLRHELGHSLIPVGEEYEGGYAYFGANSDEVENLDQLKWAHHLSEPNKLRVESVHVPLQAYPWHNLDEGRWSATFTASNVTGKKGTTGMLRTSLSSIPYPSHVRITLQGKDLDLKSAFPPAPWKGSFDRRWLEVALPHGLAEDIPFTIVVELTKEGRKAKAGQGGKMVTSVEIIEYGKNCNVEPGFIGAFPTYSETGSVTLRPTNEGCLMRNVNYPNFCPVCAEALKTSLENRIALQRSSHMQVTAD